MLPGLLALLSASRQSGSGGKVRSDSTVAAPGSPYSARSCSSANGYGYDCSLLRLLTSVCSFSAVVAGTGGVDMGILVVIMRLFVAGRPLLVWRGF